MDVTWDDVRVVYWRMQGRWLLEVQAKPGTAPGHILSLAAFGHAQQRTGEWHGVEYLFHWYAQFKEIDEDALREEIDKYLKRCGYPYWDAEYIVEELGRY